MIESLKKLIAHSLKNECAQFFNNHNSEIDTHLLLKKYAQEILDAHLYLLCAPGKLIRPLLVMLTAGCIGGTRAVQTALTPALAVELVHTYSLIHDDLPCMDNDHLRRGQPTTHVVYGDAKALLVGDGLLTAAFEILCHPRGQSDNNLLRIQLIQSLSKAIGPRGMIWGQWLDMSQNQLSQSALESEDFDWKLFKEIHINKTGKLFGACFEMGFLCGLNEFNHLYSDQKIQQIKNEFVQIGLDIGLAFQIVDDILDATQNSHTIGKTAGKDVQQNKLTAIKILGLEQSKKYAIEYLNTATMNFQHLIEKNFKYSSLGSEEKFCPQNLDTEQYLLNLLEILKSIGSEELIGTTRGVIACSIE